MDNKDIFSKMNALKPTNILSKMNEVNEIKKANLADMLIENRSPLYSPNHPIYDTRELEAGLEEIARDREEKEQNELEYRASVVNALQGIEKNTALLTEMTLLLQKNNEKQDELFQLFVEILEIMKSKDKEEADSKFATVMKKITSFTDSGSTILSLGSMVYAVYNALPFV